MHPLEEQMAGNEVTEEVLIEDLKFQLQFEQFDWGYFIETAQRAKEQQEKETKY